jgi:uncharacterized protein (DUF362 family)/ferredoxin
LKKPQVAIEKFENLEKALNLIGGLSSYVKPGDTVFLKPNACIPNIRDNGATTSPELVARAIRLLKKITDKIIVGESPFVGFTGKGNLKVTGIWEKAREEGARLVDLNVCQRKEVNVPEGLVFDKIAVVRSLVEDIDVIINLPVMKTHLKTLVSLSLKNMMGIIPGSLKHELHKRGLEKGIVDLNKAVPSHLVIMDANICQEGNGPINGTPKKLGLVIVGNNPLAVDSIACRLMGIEPGRVKHLKIASKAGLGPVDLEEIELHGSLSNYKFLLPRTYSSKAFWFLSWFESPVTKFLERLNRIEVDQNRCIRCGLCVRSCPEKALSMGEEGLLIDQRKCIKCLACLETCLMDALELRGPIYSKTILNLAEKL